MSTGQKELGLAYMFISHDLSLLAISATGSLWIRRD
jgi:hypothetical protein